MRGYYKMRAIKYPRTPHLPFSQQRHEDDKDHENPNFFLGKEVIITEKLDGGQCLIFNGEVFARSVSGKSSCPSFNFIKTNHAYKTIGYTNLQFYGENMFAEHSIPYHRLSDFLYIFGIRNESEFVSWDFICEMCKEIKFEPVPLLFRGKFRNLNQIEKWMMNELNTPSEFGEEKEGFVIRATQSFILSEFHLNTAKFVREYHIKTDKHWSKNWKPNKLKTNDN